MKVVLDACVLYPTMLREILIGAAGAGLALPQLLQQHMQPQDSASTLPISEGASGSITPGGLSSQECSPCAVLRGASAVLMCHHQQQQGV